MTTARYSGQDYLIDLMALLKMNDKITYENQKGVCFGLLMMALQAFLSGKLKPFKERIDALYMMHSNKININTQLQASQENITERNQRLKQTGQPLTLSDQEQQLIDIWAFFDGIALYQKPNKHKKVFKQKLSQSQADEISPFVVSELLEKKGGLVKAGRWNGIYQLSELKRYLNTIAAAAKHRKQNIALALTTGSVCRPHGHAIGLCWHNKKKKWLLINANRLPIQEFNETDIDSLAKEMLSGFWDKHITQFTTTLYTSGKKAKKAKKFMTELQASSEFEKIHAESLSKSKKIRRWDLISRICKAARNGKNKKLRRLIKNGAQLNKEDLYHKAAPLHLAVKYKHMKVFKKLLRQPGINLNVPRKNDGKTPLHLAVRYNNTKALQLLIDKGADLTIPDINGITPLDLLAKSNKTKMIKMLIKHCHDTDKLRSLLKHTTLPAIKRAKISRQVKIIEVLIKEFKSQNVNENKFNFLFEFIAASAQPKLLHLLIKHNVNLESLNKDHESLLSIAENNGATGFVKYYQLMSDAEKGVSRKKLHASSKLYKEDIDQYILRLNSKDIKESHKLLKTQEHKKAFKRLTFFSKSSMSACRSKEAVYDKEPAFNYAR